jgi:aminoglycoside phosphotransferase (APT) family kinase protein
MPEWSPELVVDEALARRLIADSFPQFEPGRLTLLAQGWDNAVWAGDDGWAFRFPQRELGVRGLERELEVLPRLASVLPLPIPVPLLKGEPRGDYPWPWFGFRLLPGREAALAALDDAARLRLAEPLARFLRTLHDHGTDAVADLDVPVDPLGRGDTTVRVPRMRERLEELRRLGLGPPAETLEALLERATALPPSQEEVLVHGDLHARHLLVDDDGTPTGVIDWGDLCLADPAVDLSIAWSLLPLAARRGFEHAYGAVHEATQVRARLLAVHLCAALAVYGRVEGIPGLERESLAGLARAATGDAASPDGVIDG